MRLGLFLLFIHFLFLLSLQGVTPVPYTGKISIRGVNYFGEAQFRFSLHDGQGATYWQNGEGAEDTILVPVRNGRYHVLLGGQGMKPLPPELFLNHEELYLRVEFKLEEGDDLQHLAPDQVITATPRALVAEWAKMAKVSERVSPGSITRSMLSPEVLADLNKTGADTEASALNAVSASSITREMLSADVRADLNRTITHSHLSSQLRADLNRTITKQMLGQDVLSDLNRTVTQQDLSPQVRADINATIGINRLSTEVTEKLNQEKTTTNYNAPSVGSLLAVPYGSSAPSGYSLFQRGEYKQLVWEEKAPVSVARGAYDGVKVLDDKIYFVGGWSGNREKLLERYDSVNDSWETLAPMDQAREATAAILDGKIYAIGGRGSSGNPLSSVEIYEPVTNSWSNGVSLPSGVEWGGAIAISQKIFLIGGKNTSGQNLNQVICFDPTSNQWITKANMPTARHGVKLVWFENRIWALGGYTSTSSNKVESYDPHTDSWQTEASLRTARKWPAAWVANGRIYVGGGNNGSQLSSIEVYDHRTNSWENAGNFTENKANAGSVVLNDKVYVIAGSDGSSTNKVFAADLNASVEGVYDLYRKDGDAPVGTPVVQSEYADGSVTGSKMADGAVTGSKLALNTITTAQLNEQILKYLKPEVTIVPQAPGLVFNNQTVTLLSRAEGKYLTYQWYKNGQPIAGATTDRYVIQDVNKTQHDGNYSLVVSNDFGSVTTPTATIDVNSTPTSHTVLSANNLEMIFCPPGTFMMGSPTTETGRQSDETQHQVTLTNGFYLGKYEVTQAQYETVMTGNSEGLVTDPSQYKGSNRPVETVSWTSAQAFLAQLNAMEQTAGRLPAGWKYVLPTEAQWEYACRAGTSKIYSWGNDINSSRANYNWDGEATDGNDFNQPREVGQYGANSWGFYDMHGNVWEWVHDWYAYYPSGAITDPLGPALGSNRVYRGGAWSERASQQRSAKRKNWVPSGRTNSLGFRLAFQAMPADTASPELFLTGNTVMTHSQGIPFFDPGYEAHDARDGNITDQVVVTGTIDENSTGTYLLTYAVEDAAGNSATTVTRTVTVVGNHTVDLNATVALDMIWVQPGTFVMGSPTTETGRQADRETEHNVTLTQGFYLGKYEVTQAQYEAVIGSNPSEFNATGNGDRPVEDLNWTEALAFCEQLTIRERNAGRIPADWAYVLPTESQREYACRAGTTTRFSWGDDINSSHANYIASGLGETVEVGQYAANPWGFFDMHGNVWEWTADWYSAVYPSDNPTIDPTGPASGSNRVARGGSWFHDGTLLRSARRGNNPPSDHNSRLGFRVSFQKSQ
jgi:formylglycine-generating enzyme required for sulfatase activity/N-acetylneuraminic acid mutarotase